MTVVGSAAADTVTAGAVAVVIDVLIEVVVVEGFLPLKSQSISLLMAGWL